MRRLRRFEGVLSASYRDARLAIRPDAPLVFFVFCVFCVFCVFFVILGSVSPGAALSPS